ncbi:MAG: hypothetical protein QOJ44_902 [Acidimicrobiaceae bacterium]|nr:hypothetical protein [Acidimicrobiaceae bacterium]
MSMRSPRRRRAADPGLARTVARSALVGAASGMRSQLGMAAVVLRTDKNRLPAFLRTPAATRAVTVAAGAELLADKSPRVPDRLLPPSLAARFALGGLAGGLLAHAERRPAAPAAVVASVAAVLVAKVSHDLRAWAARTVPDRLVAVAEDGLAIALALAGTRPGTR